MNIRKRTVFSGLAAATSADRELRYQAPRQAPYVADGWTIGRKLTLNLGVRYACDAGFENETCRDVADGPSATIYPAGCLPAVHMTVFKTLPAGRVLPRIFDVQMQYPF